MKAFIVAACISVAGIGIAPAAANADSEPVANSNGAERNRSAALYCRRTEVTASFVPRKVCQTKEQWEEEGVKVRESERADRRPA